METANLKAFVKVAECGSFSQAAQQLFLTQPAISKRIRQLEDQFGSRLLDRVGRQVRLTRTGESLLPHARQVLQQIESARQQIADMEGNPMGGLSMATSHHIGLHRLPPVLRAFNTQYPQVELDLNFMDSEQACQLIEHNEMDIAVVTLPFKTSKVLQFKPVWHDDLQVVCAGDHPFSDAATLTIDLLVSHPAILPSHGTFTREAIETSLGDARTALNISLETNYLETIKMMVSGGLGWSILPLSMVDDGLRALELTGFTCSRRLGIVTNRRRSLSKAAKAMIETIDAYATNRD